VRIEGMPIAELRMSILREAVAIATGRKKVPSAATITTITNGAKDVRRALKKAGVPAKVKARERDDGTWAVEIVLDDVVAIHELCEAIAE
jgi:hypothetical protein